MIFRWLVIGLLCTGCTPGNFFCKGKGTVTTQVMLYGGTFTGDCGNGFEFSKGQKSFPLPPSLAPLPKP